VLYALDADGTLIESFMRDEPCGTCDGSRRIPVPDPLPAGHLTSPIRTGRYEPCPECVGRYDRVELLPGRADRLKFLAAQPYTSFAIVTNQAGVAFGYQTEEQVHTKLAAVARACAFFYGRPFSVHCAFGHPKATVERYRDPAMVARRKPSPVMLHEAMTSHLHRIGTTIYVGDMDSDRECALAAGVTYVDADVFFRERQ
jgi:D-glycero-D-manno-heptose 1,7-bisphosphate phosphatase